MRVWVYRGPHWYGAVLVWGRLELGARRGFGVLWCGGSTRAPRPWFSSGRFYPPRRANG